MKVTHLDSLGSATQTLDYKYDVFDRRIGKASTPAVGPAYTERYVYDGDHLALKFDGSQLANRYLHGPVIDQILADEQVDALTSPGAVLWPLTDNLGTVRDLASHDSATGVTTIANHIRYDAFGGITAETNAAVDHLFAYTGREWDAEADLQYNRARWYGPAVGRWASQDPIGFQAGDANLYRYVGNRPTMMTDPTGLWGWDDDWLELGLGGLVGLQGHEVQEAAGQSIIGNPGRDVLDAVAMVDPTPLSGSVDAVLDGAIEGSNFADIAVNVGLEALPGPNPNKPKKIVGMVDDVGADSVDKFRRIPNMLSEKLAMDEAMAGAGRKIKDDLSDPKFKGMEKWQHTHHNPDGTKTVIHYVRDPMTGAILDFKFQ